MSEDQALWDQQKRLVIRNPYVMYESTITYHSKDMENGNVLTSMRNFKANARISTFLLPTCIERSWNKEHINEI
jgi:hypothetical protein